MVQIKLPRRLLLLAAALWLLAGQAMAGESVLPDELRRAAPEIAEQVEDGLDFGGGAAALWRRARGEMKDILLAGARSVAAIMVGVILLGAVESAAPLGRGGLYINLVGALWITAAAAGDLSALIGLGRETIASLSQLSKVLLPTMAAATAATGGVTAASVRQVAAVFFSDLLVTVIERALLPMVYLYIGVSAAGAVLEGGTMESLGKLLKKGIGWALSGLLVLYTGYLTISGAVAGAADQRAVKVLRSAVSGVVPVVGRILADASESLLAGAGVLRAAVGAFGALTVLGICLTPFLRLGCQYLLYQGAALVAQAAGPGKLTGLISALGDALGLVLAMSAASAAGLLIALVSALTAVTA